MEKTAIKPSKVVTQNSHTYFDELASESNDDANFEFGIDLDDKN